MSSLKSVALIGAAAAALSACGHKPETFAVANQDHREIQAREITHYLELGSKSGFLSTEDRLSLKAFISDYHTRGYGQLVVTAPTDIPGADKTLIEVRELIDLGGVKPVDLALGGYAGAGEQTAPIVLAYSAYEAHVPGCSTVNQHDWSNITSNTSLPSFGCAVNENIAMMLADPRDAQGQRRLDPADAQRQGVLLEKYRKGENTNSAQSADGSSGG